MSSRVERRRPRRACTAHSGPCLDSSSRERIAGGAERSLTLVLRGRLSIGGRRRRRCGWQDEDSLRGGGGGVDEEVGAVMVDILV